MRERWLKLLDIGIDNIYELALQNTIFTMGFVERDIKYNSTKNREERQPLFTLLHDSQNLQQLYHELTNESDRYITGENIRVI